MCLGDRIERTTNMMPFNPDENEWDSVSKDYSMFKVEEVIALIAFIGLVTFITMLAAILL